LLLFVRESENDNTGVDPVCGVFCANLPGFSILVLSSLEGSEHEAAILHWISGRQRLLGRRPGGAGTNAVFPTHHCGARAPVTEVYLLLAAVLAVTINHPNRVLRVVGTSIAALSLAMIVGSIVFADFDGTFAHRPLQAAASERFKLFFLNAQAVIGTVVSVLLFWSAWQQARRTSPARVGPLNTPWAFGLVARYAHWMTATLILCLVPMGIFISILPPGAPGRDDYVAAHESLGLAVLVLVGFRLAWLVRSSAPPLPGSLQPWEKSLAVAIHAGLYLLILGLPISGLLTVAYRGEPWDAFGYTMKSTANPNQYGAAVSTSLHDWILPGLFCVALSLHIGAVLKHHFLERRVRDVRRMLT
jgi:cytochrome b561